MKIASTTFEHNARIPERCAFGAPDAIEHMRLGENRNPQLRWSNVPEGTKSLVLMCVDSDVPSSAEDVNQEGRSISANLPRVDFYHWVLVDVSPDLGQIDEGSFSTGVTIGGKDKPDGPPGSRQGLNDYTGFLAANPDMQGDYYGYDGPCPPWNDEIVHHYHFVLCATDLDTCPVDGAFTGQDVLAAIDGHVLAESRITGTYSLNPGAGAG